MSYMNYPRLAFAGLFTTTPSTVNNDPHSYNPSVVNPALSWNANGNARWGFIDCKVTGVDYGDGSGKDDPLIGTPIISSSTTGNGRIPPKIADLDSEQQMVSEVYGFRVGVQDGGGAPIVLGDFSVAAFADIWLRGTPNSVDVPMSAYYQSQLVNLQWKNPAGSRFSSILRQISPNTLSMKFIVDGFFSNPKDPRFGKGRVVGTIGPLSSGEPVHFVAGRLLRTPTDPSKPLLGNPLFFAPAIVDETRKSVILDLGNSLLTDKTPPDAIGAPLKDMGELRLAVLKPDGTPYPIGTSNYRARNWYQTTAGIQEFKLSGEALGLAMQNPLALIDSANKPLLKENATCTLLRADSYVFRMSPGDTAQVKFYATRLGKPAAGRGISLGYDPNAVNAMQDPQNPADLPIGTPQAALTFPHKITTGADGTALLPLVAGDPKNPRGYIDGQVYGISYSLEGEGTADKNPTSFISALVWNGFSYERPATWTRHIAPIFSQYYKLYPFMQGFVKLDDYGSVVTNKIPLRHVFSCSINDPEYMPVTRDLSTAKRQMILDWFDNGCPQ